MTSVVRCDGCGRDLDSPNTCWWHADVQGLQVRGYDAGEPDEFDWCRDCVRVARSALAAIRLGAGRIGVDLPAADAVRLSDGGGHWDGVCTVGPLDQGLPVRVGVVPFARMILGGADRERGGAT